MYFELYIMDQRTPLRRRPRSFSHTVALAITLCGGRVHYLSYDIIDRPARRRGTAVIQAIQ